MRFMKICRSSASWAKLGFSEDDMTLTLGFPPEEVRSVLEEENGIADAC